MCTKTIIPLDNIYYNNNIVIYENGKYFAILKNVEHDFNIKSTTYSQFVIFLNNFKK